MPKNITSVVQNVLQILIIIDLPFSVVMNKMGINEPILGPFCLIYYKMLCFIALKQMSPFR